MIGNSGERWAQIGQENHPKEMNAELEETNGRQAKLFCEGAGAKELVHVNPDQFTRRSEFTSS
jgi:hypothetical protein